MLSASKRDSPACAIKMLPNKTARTDLIMVGKSGVRGFPGRVGLIRNDDHPTLVRGAMQVKLGRQCLLAPGGLGRLGMKRWRSLFVFSFHAFAWSCCSRWN